MEAHAESLRSEAPGRDRLIAALRKDWHGAELTARERAILEYAEKLTRAPAAMRPEDLAPLRQAGLGDRGIVDLAHVVAFFAGANRIADGLGCDLEPEMPPRPRT